MAAAAAAGSTTPGTPGGGGVVRQTGPLSLFPDVELARRRRLVQRAHQRPTSPPRRRLPRKRARDPLRWVKELSVRALRSSSFGHALLHSTHTNGAHDRPVASERGRCRRPYHRTRAPAGRIKRFLGEDLSGKRNRGKRLERKADRITRRRDTGQIEAKARVHSIYVTTRTRSGPRAVTERSECNGGGRTVTKPSSKSDLRIFKKKKRK